MLIINMLIPDLLNILFDQCNYENITTFRSLNKRRTNYANKYSLLRYYDLTTNTTEPICERGDIKAIKHIILHCSGICDDMLQWSCGKNGDVMVIKYLTSIGANIHIHGDAPLRRSAFNGNILAARYLISVGANIHAEAGYALEYSAFNGHLDVVKYLVGVGANIHMNSDDPLRWSAKHGHLEVVKYLVGAGANIHAHDDWALQWGTLNGHLEVVKYLLSIGANIHAGNDALLNNKMIKDNFSHLFV